MFNYTNIYNNRIKRSDKFSNQKFTISQYTIYNEIWSDSNDKDRKNSHYMIELIDSNNNVGIFELSLFETWKELKNYIKIGSEVSAEGSNCYDDKNELIFINIDKFIINDISISNDEISSKNGTTSTDRKLFTIDLKNNKVQVHKNKITYLIILWFILLILSKFRIFLLFFILDTIVLAVVATIENKKLGSNVSELFEKNNLTKINQKYYEVLKDLDLSNKNNFTIQEKY